MSIVGYLTLLCRSVLQPSLAGALSWCSTLVSYAAGGAVAPGDPLQGFVKPLILLGYATSCCIGKLPNLRLQLKGALPYCSKFE